MQHKTDAMSKTIKQNIMKMIHRFLVGLGILLTVPACSAEASEQGAEEVQQPSGAVTAKEWNKNVVGWNLGNQFECSAPGQDGESMLIGMPDNSIKAETAWGNPVVTKKMIRAVKEAGFNAVRIPVRWVHTQKIHCDQTYTW